MPRTELFLGNLARDVGRRDIENVFDKYGRLLRCDLKNRISGANCAFIEYDDERDAEDALRCEQGKELLGIPMIVEWAKAKIDRREQFRRVGRDDYRFECYVCGERGHYARDCRNRRVRMDRYDRRYSRSRDRHGRHYSRSCSRSHSRSRSRRGQRSSYSRSPRPRSYSRHSRSYSRGHSKERRQSRERSRSRSRSHFKNEKEITNNTHIETQLNNNNTNNDHE